MAGTYNKFDLSNSMLDGVQSSYDHQLWVAALYKIAEKVVDDLQKYTLTSELRHEFPWELFLPNSGSCRFAHPFTKARPGLVVSLRPSLCPELFTNQTLSGLKSSGAPQFGQFSGGV